MTSSSRTAAIAMAAALAGCAGTSGGQTSTSVVPARRAPAARPHLPSPLGTYIKHVVVIVQENRSFENLFAGWPGADAPMSGNAVVDGKPVVVPLQAIPFQAVDLDHLWQNGIDGWDRGKMDGFENNFIGTNGHPAGTAAYTYLKHDAIAPYRAMAAQYVLADHMFPTMFGSSFTAHLDLIAGTTNVAPRRAIVNLPNARPWGCDAPAGTATSLLTDIRHVLPGQGPFPCFTQFATMADTLDAAGVSWKYYAPDILTGPAWSAFDAISNVRYGPDWANVVSPQTVALTDPAAGALPSVAWITPDYLDSDHPETGSDTGPSWVAAIVNAIGESPYWNSTAIVIVWDDWGGFYDNVPPPQLDPRGLGIRVGCIIVSPYAKHGFVSHSQYEFGSILKFTEQAFGLPTLGPASEGYTDGRALTLVDSFDFRQAPRPFVKIAAKYPASYFLNRPPSLKPPDND